MSRKVLAVGQRIERTLAGISSLPRTALTPIAATRDLGQLPLTLGCALRRNASRRDRVSQQRLGGMRGPHDLRQQVPICCATGIMIESLHKCQTFFRAELDFLEAFHQQVSEHGSLHMIRDPALWTQIRMSGLADHREDIKHAYRKETVMPSRGHLEPSATCGDCYLPGTGDNTLSGAPVRPRRPRLPNTSPAHTNGPQATRACATEGAW